MAEARDAEIAGLRRVVRFQGIAIFGGFSLALIAAAHPHAPTDLRLRSLTIVDRNGTPRIILGAPLPDPMVLGKRSKRAAAGSGLLLNGPDGNERGGYMVTDVGDEGLLTLDASKRGEVFKVVANPDSGASLFLMHQSGSAMTLTTYRGTPEIQLTGHDGHRIAAIPADAPPL